MKTTKFNDVTTLKLGFRRDEAAEAVGSVQLLEDMVRAKWLKPVINRHKLVIFDRGDIQRAWARILTGEQPPQRIRKPKQFPAMFPARREPINTGPKPK